MTSVHLRRALRRHLTIAVAVALALPSAVSPVRANAGCPGNGSLFEPADGKTLLIVGQDWQSTEAYVDGVGVVPGGFMTYTALAAPVSGLHTPVYSGGMSYGQWFVDNYPDTVMNVAITIDPPLVNQGAFDAQIDVLGDWITSARRPILLRPGYEFDHPQHQFDPAQFIAAWRRIVDRLRANGVTNVAFVWHSAGNDVTYLNLPRSAWYPGDDYVDWVAVSIFPSGHSAAGQHLVAANQMADIADAHGKPMMIAESTPHGRDTSVHDPNVLWNDWFTNVITFVEQRNVKVWSYINQDWEAVGWSGWGDSRVEVNPVLRGLWLAEIGRDRYLQQSPDLYCSLGYPG